MNGLCPWRLLNWLISVVDASWKHAVDLRGDGSSALSCVRIFDKLSLRPKFFFLTLRNNGRQIKSLEFSWLHLQICLVNDWVNCVLLILKARILLHWRGSLSRVSHRVEACISRLLDFFMFFCSLWRSSSIFYLSGGASHLFWRLFVDRICIFLFLGPVILKVEQ